MSKFDKIATIVCVIGLSFLFGLETGQKHPVKLPIPIVNEKVDTLIVRDTIVQNTPVFVQRTRIDSVLVPVTDTIKMQDTLYVYLDRERLVWEDSLCTIWASGIRPQIDSVAHYINERIVTYERVLPVKVQPKWGIGIQAGMGASKDGLTPYVGVGLHYNILSW